MHRVSSSQAAATATATATAAKAATAATFTCHVCSRAFNRRDHLARHERVHSKSRPFHCGLCGRRFGRRDVLLRHSSHVHPGQRPCEYEDTHIDVAQQRLLSYPPPSSSASDSASKGLGAVTEDEHVAATGHPEPTRENPESVTEYAASTDTSSSSVDIDAGLSRVAAFNESDLDAFLGLLLGMSSYSEVARTLRQEPPYRQHASSRAISHQSGDRNSLPAPPQQRPASLSSHPGPAVSNIAPPIPSFHHGLFPAEQPTSPLTWVRLMPPVPYLTQSSFDRLIQSYKRHSATIRPFLHFPTLDISLHMLGGKGAPSTLVHSPSCTGWKRKPHRCLLLSILALGAICDQRGALALEIYHETRREILGWLAQVQKLGFEGAPPLELIQAFINYVCCGTKFGDKPIEDLTVSHSASLRSLVLAMDLEQSGSRPLVWAQSTCPSCSINVTVEWLDWVRYEEGKRTFLAYFALMSSTLTYLDTVTSVDWRGVKHRLPCSDEVWDANSPLSWRSAFQSKPLPPLFAPEVEALFAGEYSGGCPASASTKPEASTTSASVSKVSQTSEPRNDYSCFILISAVHRETWLQRLHNKVDTDATQTALQQWQAKWLRLAPHWGSQPWTPLLACSLAMFDNTQILLHLDIKEAKEALLSRDYGRFCVTLPAFNLRLDSEGSGCSLLSSRDDWQQTRDIFFRVCRRAAFRHIALYSVNALELTFKIHSKSTLDGTKFTFAPHTGTSIFYCIQLLTSWICFFSNCLNQGLYLNFLDSPGSSEEREDICLVGKVLAYARNRKIQFNAILDVPSSPEMLSGLRAGRLASDLLELHSQMFHKCGTWPGMLTPTSTGIFVNGRGSSIQPPWECVESPVNNNIQLA